MFLDLKSILPQAIRKSGISKKVEQEEIMKLFRRVCADFLSEETAAKIRPLYLFDKTLTLVTLDAAAVQAMKKNEEEIRRKVNEKIGGNAIIKIRYLA